MADNRASYDARLKSDEFINDHNGYLNAKAHYDAYDHIIRAKDIFINAGLEAQKRLKKDYGQD